jgi:hypothetical protein
METKLNTIDPNQNNVPESAVIQKVTSENDRLPNGEHEKAVQAFFRSDSIASGIGKDFAFVEKIPQLIDEIIKNKSWECLYVSKSVVTPYYCRYTKGTDSENFRAFIAAKRPNGLGTTIETIDRLLETELDIQRKFRAIIYESRQGERNDLEDMTSYGDRKKLESELSQTQQSVIRAANRAAEAIPEIGELLDRGLIAIDLAAKLGRDIKDLDNLTAEEREYVDKRDLVGLRIKQYVYTNMISEDEDKEPAYSRQLNEFVKDLLGIKDRSKSVRMDDPKKAAKKLLEFYEGQKLKELLEYLTEGLEISISIQSKTLQEDEETLVSHDRLATNQAKKHFSKRTEGAFKGTIEVRPTAPPNKMSEVSSDIPSSPRDLSPSKTSSISSFQSDEMNNNSAEDSNKLILNHNSQNSSNLRLSSNQLAERLGLNRDTITNFLSKQPNKFSQWTQKKDPEGLAWQKTEKQGRGRSHFFSPVQTEKKQ